jgi:NitT/TauT family transport system substrate-binding protein
MCLLVAVLLAAGCGRTEVEPAPARPAERIVLQTDWFAQPEHGGFYQAQARGFYAEAGIEVEILPGGPNAQTVQKVLRGRAQFAMNRADTIYRLASEDVPVVLVMATLQHDPQAVMVHAASPVRTLADLDGRRVMAIPGLAWIAYVESRYGIKLRVVPHDFGMERFLADPELAQQCLLTNEPFYAALHDIPVRVLPLRASGFDPYHGIYGLRSFIDANPDLVRRFIAASIRGWEDFIHGDPAPAFALIAARNPKMSVEFMTFARAAMLAHHLVEGEPGSGGAIGRLDPARLDAMAAELRARGIVGGAAPQEGWYRSDRTD